MLNRRGELTIPRSLLALLAVVSIPLFEFLGMRGQQQSAWLLLSGRRLNSFSVFTPTVLYEYFFSPDIIVADFRVVNNQTQL